MPSISLPWGGSSASTANGEARLVKRKVSSAGRLICRPAISRGLYVACAGSLLGVSGLKRAVVGGGSPVRGSRGRDLNGWETGANGRACGGDRSGLAVSALPVAAATRALGADCLRPVGRGGRCDVVSALETVTETLLTGGVGVTVGAGALGGGGVHGLLRFDHAGIARVASDFELRLPPYVHVTGRATILRLGLDLPCGFGVRLVGRRVRDRPAGGK